MIQNPNDNDQNENENMNMSTGGIEQTKQKRWPHHIRIQNKSLFIYK